MNNIWLGQPHRNPAYLDYIRSLPCAVCASTGRNDAHHIVGQGREGVKASDYLTIPLCREDHSTLHRKGVRSWESKWGPQSHYLMWAILRAIDDGVLRA